MRPVSSVPVVLLAMSSTVLLPVADAQARHGGEDAAVTVTAPCGRMTSVLTLTPDGHEARYRLGRDPKGRRWHLTMSKDGAAIAAATRVAHRPAGTATWRVPIAQAGGVISVVARAGATSCVVSATAGPAAAGTTNGSGSSVGVDSIVVSKCYTNATKTTGGELLIKASSSDPAATLLAYRPDGSLIGEVQNGGGGRYGGTVMPYQSYDPGTVTIRSSSGGSVTVPTGPFQL